MNIDNETGSIVDELEPHVAAVARDERDSWKDKQRKLQLMSNPTKILTRNRQKGVVIKVEVPRSLYESLQRIVGNTDGERVLTLLKIAHERIEAALLERGQAELEAKYQGGKIKYDEPKELSNVTQEA